MVVRAAAREQALALDGDVLPDPAKSWPSSAAGGAGTPAGRGERVPRAYRKCRSFSDFWKAYADILPEGTHRCVRREAGETVHMER